MLKFVKTDTRSGGFYFFPNFIFYKLKYTLGGGGGGR